MAKTWRLKNIGTCTWTTAYSIVFYAGAQMGAPSVVNMPYSVAPGATVDITVNMAAPTTPGHYRGYWMIRNASSVLFGVGPSGTWSFFIDIVVATTGYTTSYDLVANYCSATWTSAAGVLRGVSPAVAVWRPYPGANNIREIALHLAFCENGVANRLSGKKHFAGFKQRKTGWAVLLDSVEEKQWKEEDPYNIYQMPIQPGVL
jgi:hypothetical protein